jgi:hypothetical protein
MNRLFAAAALCALAAWACNKPGATTGGLTQTQDGPALPVDHPAIPNLGLVSASAQRMSVPQLMLTYPQLFGNQSDGGAITWMIGNTPGLVQMSDALGNPDFVNITAEDLSANPLYLKFADDAARDVCLKGLTADQARTGSSRQLLPYVSNSDTFASNPSAINQNLAYLKLLFHGVKVDPGDASLQPLSALWSQVYTSASASSSNLTQGSPNAVFEAWRVVCVAMVTAPEFHIY